MVVYDNSRYEIQVITGQEVLYQDGEILGKIINKKKVGQRLKIVYLNAKGNEDTRWIKKRN